MRKAIVIGLDGATFDIIGPWAARGWLPTLDMLMKKGAYGPLESTIPDQTAVAWTSFATGTNPGNHGIFSFVVPQSQLDETKLVGREDVVGETIYERLDSEAMRCTLINFPLSEGSPINGPILASLFDRTGQPVSPPELADEIPILRDYRVFPLHLNTPAKSEGELQDIRELEATRFACAQALFRREWDFFFVMFSLPDQIQHGKYVEMISEKVSESATVVKAFQDVDGYVRWFLQHSPPDCVVLVLSDHGFGRYSGVFNINEWLAKKGLLKYRSMDLQDDVERRQRDLAGARTWLTIRLASPIRYILNAPGLYSLLRATYVRLSSLLPIYVDRRIRVDVESTLAYSLPSSSGIWLNDERFGGKISGEESVALRKRLIRELNQLRGPDQQKIMEFVAESPQVYHGHAMDKAPDIVFGRGAWRVDQGAGPIFVPGEVPAHAPYGIFIAHGPDVAEGREVPGAKIWDMNPTLLHWMGRPIPSDTDGRVIVEAFSEGSQTATRRIAEEDPTTVRRRQEARRVRALARRLRQRDR